MTNPEIIVVEQCDIDRANEWRMAFLSYADDFGKQALRELAEDFARHRLAERERVVAWLRDPTTAISLNVAWASYRKDGRPTAGTQQNRGTVFLACIDAADAISRGDHAIAMETGTAMTAGHGPKDDSATRRGSPGNGRASGQEEG